MNLKNLRVSFLALVGLLLHLGSNSQESNVELFLHSYAGKYPHIPYYIWANQFGQIKDTTGNMVAINLYADGKWQLPKSNTALKGGFRMYHKRNPDEKTIKFHELFAGVETKKFAATAGWFADSLIQGNL